MFIPTKINKNIGVSIIKKNSKLSLCIANTFNGTIELMKECDSEFPFSNPLVTNDAVKVFEFIIETNNFVKRRNS